MGHMARIIEGQDAARDILRDVHDAVAMLREDHRLTVTLAFVVVGDDANTLRLIETKKQRAEEVGIRVQAHTLPADSTDAEVITVIDGLNHDDQINGILIQHYMPRYRDARRLIRPSTRSRTSTASTPATPACWPTTCRPSCRARRWPACI